MKFTYLRFIVFIVIQMSVSLLFGQTQEENSYRLNKLALNARVDFDYLHYNDTTTNKIGFAGKYLNFMLEGQLTDKFSYHYRQRLNISEASFSSFYKGCDWLYLQYMPHKQFSLSAGKQVIFIGGYEYDFAPIDVYYWSDFCSNITCYEIGFAASYYSKNQNHNLTFQICNSPFVSKPFEGLFAYNLIWYGKMGVFSTIYSINMIEYEKGKFINYIALGNMFTFNKLSFYVDITNRAGAKQQFLFDDFSIVGEFKYKFNTYFTLFCKLGYDVNKAQKDIISPKDYIDRCVLPGTEFVFYGLGGEFFPIKNSQDVRLHACFSSQKANKQLVYQTNVGLTWNIDFLKIIDKHKANKKEF